MARRAFKALATFNTIGGPTHIRRWYSPKQASWILILEGPHQGLRQLLPDKAFRAPSTRTQLSMDQPSKKVSDIMAFFQAQLPLFYERMAGKAVPTPVTSAPTYQTIGELMKLIDHEATTTLRTGSVSTYRHQATALMRVLPPDTMLVALTREHLQTVIGALSAIYSSTTVVCIRNVLRKALVRALDDRLILANPLVKVKVPKPVSKQQAALSREQRDRVLREAELRGRDMHLLFHLLLGTGLRRSEALALTWEDVDLERRLVTVRSSDHFLTKTGNARSVPIPNGPFAILSLYARPHGYVLKPDQPYASGRYRWDFSKGFASVVTAAGVPGCTPHSLRHHYASWFLENGGSIFRLAAHLGHTMVETSQRYAHLVPGYGDEQAHADAASTAHSIPA